MVSKALYSKAKWCQLRGTQEQTQNFLGTFTSASSPYCLYKSLDYTQTVLPEKVSLLNIKKQAEEVLHASGENICASVSSSNTDDNFISLLFHSKILSHDPISTRGRYSSGTDTRTFLFPVKMPSTYFYKKLRFVNKNREEGWNKQLCQSGSFFLLKTALIMSYEILFCLKKQYVNTKNIVLQK